MGPIWPGGGGVPENQRKYEKVKKANEQHNHKRNICFEMWGDFLKKRRAQRLGVYCGIMKTSDNNVV